MITEYRTDMKPVKVDARDKRFRFHRVVGAIETYPNEYDADAGKTMPDQMADNRPSECTAYTIVDIAMDQDKEAYSADYHFMNTLLLMNVGPDNWGADARMAFKAAVSVGLLPIKLEPKKISKMDQEEAARPESWPATLMSETIQKPAYLPIYPSGGRDWFDAVRSALITGKKEKRTIGAAIPWYGEWNDIDDDGILPEKYATLVSWHEIKISGWVTRTSRGKLLRGGEQFLKCKVWNGKRYGDRGWCYMSRPLAQRILSTWGTYVATLQDVPTGTLEEIRAQRIGALESLLAMVQNIIIELRYRTRL